MKKNIGGHLMMALGKKIWKSIKCTPYCGLLKGMGKEAPIGNMIIAYQWKIIHCQ
jgi:hypothetical protein